YVGVGKATISRQLRRLEDLGLITRTPDPQDSRGHLISLIPEGARQVQAAGDGRRRWLNNALSTWTPEELETLASSLAHLNVTIEQARRVSPA
ncbi:MAG TPA: MarR family transcriptional regulator, partial [Propionicimonas sp.]